MHFGEVGVRVPDSAIGASWWRLSVLALVSLWPANGEHSGATQGSPIGVVPALACYRSYWVIGAIRNVGSAWFVILG